MSICLRNANIAHFRNYLPVPVLKTAYHRVLLTLFYEINSIKNKKGVLFPEHLLNSVVFFYSFNIFQSLSFRSVKPCCATEEINI